MSLKLTFQIEMISDYHVGAGYGKGTEIDSALLRDADGLPVLRGTVLNGLLRDGLWRLLRQRPLQKWQRCQESGCRNAEERYCGQYTVGDVAMCPMCRLFGTPRTMKRWRIGSARPLDRETLAGTLYKTEDTACQRVMRVRVNPRTRRAAPQKLFSEEHGGQMTFTFTAACPADGEAALDEAALLVAAARFVRQLGRSRRRGQGECLFSLVKVEGADLGKKPQERLLDRFEAHWLRGEPEALAQSKGQFLEQGRKKPSEEKPVRLWVLARADEPLLIAERAAAGNQFRSQPAILGKTLRGALAARVAERFDLDDPTTYDAFIALFLRGAVRFPTLYPLFRSKTNGFFPAAPMPLDGFTCKVCSQRSVQWGTQEIGPIKQCAACGNEVKGVREKFFSLRKLKPEHFVPEQQSEMHIRVDPASGRVEEGQLFEYEALKAGQFFTGEMICTDEDAWELLQALTDLEEEMPVSLRLGKATRRGYGKVTLWLERRDDNEPQVWIQQSIGERVDANMDELTLTLLTDAIITDTWGRFATGFEDGWLSRELGFKVKVVEGRDFAAAHLVDGFNAHLRLPRWRDVALVAGSTVRLQIEKPSEAGLLTVLARIEHKGIGQRRNEGYGQVAFNHPIHKDCTSLTGTKVRIPREVDLAEKQATGGSRRVNFCKEWEEELNDPGYSWGQCKGSSFLGLARWLDAHRHKDIGDLLEKMETVGEPDDLLVEHIGGEQEYGDREIANPLTKEQGFKLVKRMMKQLQEKDEAHWPLGIRMLADRLAEVAGEKEEGR